VLSQLFYQTFVVQDLGVFDRAVHLAYTLVDFGARRTEITAAQARLVAANLSFNNEHLVLIREVTTYSCGPLPHPELCGWLQRAKADALEYPEAGATVFLPRVVALLVWEVTG
jgi:hypothetical protein